MQIEQRIKKELEENPALEEGSDEEEERNDDFEEEQFENETDKDKDEFTIDDYLNDEDIPEYRLQAKNYSKDDDKRNEIPFSVGNSFHEHLESQLGLRDLDEKQLILGEFILGNIDEDGYLRREIVNIVDDLAFLQNVSATEEELEAVLKIIQDLDPAGVGARTLQECLVLQIERKDQSVPSIKLAYSILNSYFDEFTKKHYDKIISRLNITEADLKAAINEILKLNPKPGGAFSDPYNKSNQHIIPDFILEYSENGFDLFLNSRNLPELKLSRAYNEMLESYSKDRGQNKEMKEAVSFVKQKLDSARWFIDAIKQRQNTLLLTMNALILQDLNKQLYPLKPER